MNLDLLLKRLRYDKDTGDFIWIDCKRKASKNGSVAGTILRSGYRHIQIDGKQYLAHRLVWLITYGYLPENYIDHINRNRSDNRVENLREVSNQCNQRNSAVNIKNTSGVKGVTYDKGYWLARIRINKRIVHVGCSKDFTEAVAFRLAAEQSLGWEGCDSSSSSYLHMREYLCKLG